MPKAIVWSDNAKQDVTELVSYLTMNWGEKITNEYIDLLDELIKHYSAPQNVSLNS